MVKGWPCQPERLWRKKMGEPNLIFTNMAIAARMGVKTSTVGMTKHKSNMRFAK
jgi:hypothetical protein